MLHFEVVEGVLSMPATVTSEARIQANRINARKSTGPKTAEGKARSRANAVKHGLTGEGLALPNEDAAEVEARFEAVREELAPRSVLGTFLAHQVALMTVRCQRAARWETATRASKIRNAASEFVEARNAEADHLIEWITSDPVGHRRKLMAMPEGVDRLIEGLLGLKGDLEREGTVSWNYAHGQKVEALFGKRSGDVPHSRAIILSNAIQGDFKEVDPAEVAHLPTLAEKRNWACDELTTAIDAEVERLRAQRETLDVGAIALDRAEAGDRAQFDPSYEATLARRYEAAATRELYRALRELRAVEKADAGDRDATGNAEAVEVEVAPLEADAPVVIAPTTINPTAEPRSDDEIKSFPGKDLGSTLGSFGKSTPDESNPMGRGVQKDQFDPVGPAFEASPAQRQVG